MVITIGLSMGVIIKNMAVVMMGLKMGAISVGNYMVREVLMKNRRRVWQNIYNSTSGIINISPNKV